MDPNDSNGRSSRPRKPEPRDPAAARRYAHARNFAQGERVAIFIDGSNLYNGMRENLRSTRVNFAELIQQLLRDRPVFRTYYYNSIALYGEVPSALSGQRVRVKGREVEAMGIAMVGNTAIHVQSVTSA